MCVCSKRNTQTVCFCLTESFHLFLLFCCTSPRMGLFLANGVCMNVLQVGSEVAQQTEVIKAQNTTVMEVVSTITYTVYDRILLVRNKTELRFLFYCLGCFYFLFCFHPFRAEKATY